MTRSHLLATVALCTLDCGIAQAQTVRAEPAAPSDLTTDTNTDVIVSGYRASLETAREQKRQSAAIIDAIAAEDISQFPDNSATEALNRLPGVTTQETRGERQSVTVRGLSQVLTTVNGMEDYTGISRQTLPGSMHHHLAVDRGGDGSAATCSTTHHSCASWRRLPASRRQTSAAGDAKRSAI